MARMYHKQMAAPSPEWGRKSATKSITTSGCKHPQRQNVVGVAGLTRRAPEQIRPQTPYTARSQANAEC